MQYNYVSFNLIKFGKDNNTHRLVLKNGIYSKVTDF